MEKYKVIIKPVVFLAIFALLLAWLSFVFTPKDNTKKAGMPDLRPNGILSEKENSIDVLIIGDSESYISVSPMEMYEEYGITSYVMGTNAQKIFYSYNYLLEALDNQQPKIVILETNTFFRNLDDYQKIVSIGERYNAFLRYHDRWKKLKLNDLWKKPNYTNENIMKGYYYVTQTNSYKEQKPKYMSNRTDKWDLPKDDEYYIRKIYKKCKENNIELVFYTAPNIKNWWTAKHNTIQDLANELEIDYIDTNLIPEIDIDWFTDTKDNGDHVNYYGAKKISAYLGKYLSENKKLEDHREDEYYEDWNTCLEKYKKIIEDKNILKY